MAENIKQWKLEKKEIAIILPKSCGANGDLQVNIPKLMPLISRGKPKVSPPFGLSAGCLCNSGDCKPTVSSQICSQNFITVPHCPNRDFQNGTFYEGDKLYVEFENDDIYQMHTDNSMDVSS